MIARSHSLPRLPASVSPSPQRLARSQSFSGAIPGSPVQPSAPIDNAAPEQAVVMPAHPQPPAMVFDVGRLSSDVQQLIAAVICNPHDICTLEQLQEALKVVKAASEANPSFYRGALPLLHALALRLFGAGRLKATSLDSLPKNLPQILEGIVARVGLSGLQCLSDLVNGSLGENPDFARKAFAHWIHLAITATASTALPYKALPTLIAMRLGKLLRRSDVPPTHALTLMKQLVRMAKTGGLPPDIAMPTLIEVALLVQAQELSSNTSFRAPPQLGLGWQWVELGSADVLDAMNELKGLSEGIQKPLLAVALVLVTRWRSGGAPLTQATVLTALHYLADCPHPLLGCLAEALDIIQGMDLGHDPHVEELLARCAAKRASARLLAVELGPPQ